MSWEEEVQGDVEVMGGGGAGVDGDDNTHTFRMAMVELAWPSICRTCHVAQSGTEGGVRVDIASWER